MQKSTTRSRVVMLWFVGVALSVVASVAFDVAVTLGTGAMLLVLGLVPPVIVMLLWPEVQPLTVAEGGEEDAFTAKRRITDR